MPSPKSQIRILYEGLLKTSELSGLAGLRVLLSAKNMARNGAPPRIVLYPTGGKIVNPRNKSTANRDVDRAVIAHCWGRDFDEVCYLETLLVQALVNQGAGGDPVSPTGATPGVYWMATEDEWDYSEDSNRQGEELYVLLTAINSLDKVAMGTGQVQSILYQFLSTTLNASMLAGDTTAAVVSTVGFPPSGMVTIDSEQMLFAGTNGTTISGLVRGVNGTTPASHSNGAVVNVS